MFRFRISALPWLPKNWSSTSALSLCIDCQKYKVPLPHFCSALNAKYVKFCSRTSALSWLTKIWSSAFRTCSARTSIDVKFRFCISSLPGLPKICSFTSALSLNLDCQRSEDLLPHFHSVLTDKDLKFRFPHLFCQDFHRCEVPLLHFISAWTSKDLQFHFCTFAQSWLPKIWRSASSLTLCLHCQIWVVPPPHFPSALTAKDL